MFLHPTRIGTEDRGMDLGLRSQEKSSHGTFPAAAIETLVLDVVGHVKCAGLKSLCIDSSSADAGASRKWSRPLQGTIWRSFLETLPLSQWQRMPGRGGCEKLPESEQSLYARWNRAHDKAKEVMNVRLADDLIMLGMQ